MKQIINEISGMYGPGDEDLSWIHFALYIISLIGCVWYAILVMKHAKSKGDFILYFFYSLFIPGYAICISYFLLIAIPILFFYLIGSLIYNALIFLNNLKK